MGKGTPISPLILETISEEASGKQDPMHLLTHCLKSVVMSLRIVVTS